MSPELNKAKYRVDRAEWSREREMLREIRRRVFVREQGVPEELEWDGKDETAVHLLARNNAGRPVGTARLLPTGQIGRMAVLLDWRGLGIGMALLKGLLAIAAAEDYPRPFLNAQASALPFYRRAGFLAVGAEFFEAGIPHRKMILEDLAEAGGD
jgi:predicted GNAT family N-acyltransferase